MKNLISSVLLLFTIMANAQYQPTAVEGRRWNQYLHPIMITFPGMRYHEFRGDTIYNGKTLKKLISVDGNGQFKSLDAIVYEDTLKPSLTYHYPKGSLFGDSVVIDFSLSIGDSSVFFCGGDTGYYRLDSISNYRDLTNTHRKEYLFSSKMSSSGFGSKRRYFIWIEGFGRMIGNLQYPLAPICLSDPPAIEVICIFDSTSTQLYQNPNYSICDGVSISETDYPQSAIFPNPASTFVEMEYINLKEIKIIQIINSDSVIVMEISNPEKERIDIGMLPAGLYTLNITLYNNVRLMNKLVKTN